MKPLAVVAATAAYLQLLAPVPALAAFSAQSGHWSHPATWGGAQPPTSVEEVTITAGHTVIFDLERARVSGVTVEAGAVLRFDPLGGSNTLETDANVVVRGTLEMRPGAASVVHTLRFVDVDETRLKGGGMDVVAADVGLWVMGAGQLDIQGATKTGWTHLAGGASKGATQVTLKAAPVGWAVGDRIAIAPTEAPWSTSDRRTGSWSSFDEATITAISGATLTLDQPLQFDHPEAVGFRGTYTAEVMNLTRNVVIEGTGEHSFDPRRGGRAHTFIRSTRPQSIQYATFRLMGPRVGDGVKDVPQITGRYPLHFHHSHDGSRGSIVRGTVIHNNGSYGYVPHESNGILFEDTVQYHGFEAGYWWDEGDHSEGITWRRAIAARIDSLHSQRLAGFELGRGRNNTIEDSAAVGVNGGIQSGGFQWQTAAGSSHPWHFRRVVSHNNRGYGIFIWQNCGKGCPGLDTLEDLALYHNGGSGREKNMGGGLFAGSYKNNFAFFNLDIFGNEFFSIELHARAIDEGVAQPAEDGYINRVEDFDSDTRILIPKHSSEARFPYLILNGTAPGLVIDEDGGKRGYYDFVNVAGITPETVEVREMHSGSVIRVQQPNGTAFRIDGPSGAITPIAPFYDIAAAPPPDPEPEPDPEDTEPPTGGDPDPSGLLAHWPGPRVFDGVGDHVDISPLDVSGSAITLAAWVNAANRDGDWRVISKATGTSTGSHWWKLGLRSGDVRFRLKTGGSTATLVGKGGPSVGAWHHLAATYDGTTMRVYVDGQQVGSTAKRGAIDVNPTVPAWIGGNPGSNSHFWPGQLANVRIYDRALSAAEIAGLAADAP